VKGQRTIGPDRRVFDGAIPPSDHLLLLDCTSRDARDDPTLREDEDDEQRLRDYGADRIIDYIDYIDYTATPIDVKGQPFDVVLNLVGTSPEETAALVGVVADGGFHVGTMTSGTADPAPGRAHAADVRP